MSGITGLFYLNDRPLEHVDIEKMTDILTHRGPDDGGVWHEDSIGLGHRMLWTTLESLHEKLPFSNATSDLAITADARIDNRRELLSLLGFSDRPAEDVADSQLILAAYEKWGEQCPEKLIGDFAFAIWDKQRRRLFCARDHFGIRPYYYYYAAGQMFAFASEIKALLCVREIPRRLNELRVAYHLAGAYQDSTLTFYQDVFRLRPGHCMIVSQQGMHLHSFWSLDPSRELHFNSDKDYEEAFREIFAESVRCRLRSAFPIGSELSGGLDSSSVTCMAEQILADDGRKPLHTISGIYDKVTECGEQPFIDAVVAQGDFRPHYTYFDHLSPLNEYERIHWHYDEPITAPTAYMGWELSRVAHEHGVRILLDGQDGDTAVSYGLGYLAEQARAGQWKTFIDEAQAISQNQDFISTSWLLGQYGLPYLTELAQQWRWIAFTKEVNHLSKYLKASRRYLFQRYGINTVISQFAARFLHNRPEEHAQHIIKSQFAGRVSLKEHLKTMANGRDSLPETERMEHYNYLTAGLIPYVFELMNQTAAAFGLEKRHPFSDRRLLEFCLALPPKQKLNHGWTRMIMRRTLTDIVPPKVQWRKSKAVNSKAFTYSLLNFEAELLEEISNNLQILGSFIDIITFQKVYRRYLSDKQPNSIDERAVWNVVALALWLKYTKLEP